MSSAAVARPRKSFAKLHGSYGLPRLAAVLRIEIKKTLWMRRSIWIYLLAFAPTVMFGIHALTSPMGRNCSIEEDTRVLAYTFQIFYLRVGIFFGCMGLFTWLFRGEIVEKSLHYYFLSPMRREVAGSREVSGRTDNYIAGLWRFRAALLHFCLRPFWRCRTGVCIQRPGSWPAWFLSSCDCARMPGIWLNLSCAEPALQESDPARRCGSSLGIVSRRVAPSLLQKFSVTFYLKQLSPVTIPPDGIMALFTVMAEPVSPWLAMPGIAVSERGNPFVCAGYRIRRTEISYLAD